MPSPDNNPFQAPQNPESVRPEKGPRAPNAIAVFVVVIVAGLGAAATFFVTCLGVLAVDYRSDTGIFYCVAASFFGFMLFARLGVIIANGFSRANMVLSWASIFVAAVTGALTFYACAIAGGFGIGLLCSTIACTFVIWRLHRFLANRHQPQEQEKQGF